MMTKEGSTKSVNFMTPRIGCIVLECGHIGDTCIVKMLNFFKFFYSLPGHKADQLDYDEQRI